MAKFLKGNMMTRLFFRLICNFLPRKSVFRIGEFDFATYDYQHEETICCQHNDVADIDVMCTGI